MEKVVILARVSTQGQDYERQIIELKKYCNDRSWQVEKIFANKISGAAINEERSEIMNMVEYVKKHDVQRVVCLEISRLGRNTLQALQTIEILTENGVSLFVKNYGLETLAPNGKINPVASLLMTILLEIAQMERLMIKERMESGRKQYIAKCRANGVKMGRPASYKKSDDEYKSQYYKEISLLKKGISLRNIHAITGTSVNTLRKLKDIFVS